MLLAPGQKAEGDGIGEQPHADAMKPDSPAGGGVKVRQAGSGQPGQRDEPDGGDGDPSASHPDRRQAVECQFDAKEGAAPDHAKAGKQSPVERRWRPGAGLHQVTALRVWNSGRSQRVSFMMAARRSTACQTSAKRV